MEPPPAPISIIWIDWILSGNPLPRWKRSWRAISSSSPIIGSPFGTRQSLAVVPPMSKDMTLASSAWRAYSAAATAPGGRARLDQPHRRARCGRARHNAAAGRHPKHTGDDPVLAQIGFKPFDMLRHQRPCVCIDHRRRGTVVFTDLRADIGGQRDRKLRVRQFGQQSPDASARVAGYL